MPVPITASTTDANLLRCFFKEEAQCHYSYQWDLQIHCGYHRRSSANVCIYEYCKGLFSFFLIMSNKWPRVEWLPTSKPVMSSNKGSNKVNILVKLGLILLCLLAFRSFFLEIDGTLFTIFLRFNFAAFEQKYLVEKISSHLERSK